MIYRLWTTGVHATQVSRYRDFAEHRSLPMFRQQQGFRGVAFLQSGQEHFVFTAWDSTEDVDRLSTSASYRSTVQALDALGVLTGRQEVHILTPEIVVASPVVI